jgi:hypothetical protein
MKKLVFMAIIALLTLSACSGGSKDEHISLTDANAQTDAASNQDNSKQEDSNSSGIEVDKGSRNVEITLPASFFGDQDAEQVIEDAKSKGVSEATVNDDGSVTYKMSKATHEKMMKEMKDQAVQSIEELKNGEDFTSIKDITYNDQLSEFTMVVDRAAYENSFDGFAALGLGLQGMFYQAFDGVPSDKLKVTINIQDESTGEIFNTVVYPDQMKSE